MPSLGELLDIFLHLNTHLNQLAADYGPWVYGILFLIVFCETGLVVTPFLPGDSLLFAVGALAAGGSINLWLVIGLLIVAAILGDAVNYHIGRVIGPRVFAPGRRSRWFRREHLDRTHAFFEKYGGKTIIIARFVPIVRTFAPFVAGIGAMTYRRFLLYNFVGAVVWVLSITLAGYFFGNLPVVQENFSLVILAIIIISLLPGVYEWWRARGEAVRGKNGQTDKPSREAST